MSTTALRLPARSGMTLGLVTVAGGTAFAWPLLVHPGSSLVDPTGYSGGAPWVFVAVLPALLLVVLAELAEGGMDAKSIALLGVLTAVGAALRPLGTGTAGLETVWILIILGGRALGRGFGFVLGALTLLASALLTAGVGPWLPFQMLAAGWVGFGAGCLPPVRGRVEPVVLATYGLLAGLAYGLAMNLSFWPFTAMPGSTLAYVPGAALGVNVHRLIAFDLATSMGFDIPRGVTTAVALALLSRPLLMILRRAARRAAFDAPVEFSTDLPAPSLPAPEGGRG